MREISLFPAMMCAVMTTYGSVNYTYGRFKTDTSLQPLDHITPVNGKISLRYQEWSVWFVEAYSLFNSKKALKDYNLAGEDNLIYATSAGTPAWNTFNIKAGVTMFGNINFQAGIENVFDRNYRPFASGISAPGRNYTLSIRYCMNRNKN